MPHVCVPLDVTPTADDLILNCSSSQILKSNKYDISLTVQYGPTYSPAALFAISYIRIDRVELSGNGAIVPGGNGEFDGHRLRHNEDGITLESTVNFTLSALELGNSYQFIVSVALLMLLLLSSEIVVLVFFFPILSFFLLVCYYFLIFYLSACVVKKKRIFVPIISCSLFSRLVSLYLHILSYLSPIKSFGLFFVVGFCVWLV